MTSEGALALLDHARDAIAGQIKKALSHTEFGGGHVRSAQRLLIGCKAIIATAAHLGS
jgi:glutamine synthetase